MSRFIFPVGYHDIHRTKIVNYQLNRWHSLGYCRLEDLKAAAAGMRGMDDFKDEMVREGEQALAEERYVNGAFYMRGAEFFVPPHDPDKLGLYDRFIDIFYSKVAAADPIERVEVPYDGGALPTLRLPARQKERRGTILIHGGFDSFMEEFYSMAWYFADRGYEVIMFDGPGQGGALKRHQLYWNQEWEKPTAAVLDYYGCENVTILGISMGAWLCVRAAAFDPRIERVIIMGVGYDFLAAVPGPLVALVKFLFRYPGFFDRISWLQARFSQQERWALYNLLHISGEDSPAAASRIMLDMNAENLHSERVTQDVLLLTGAEDHFGQFNMHLKLHRMQIEALIGARSVTDRIFTREEHAQNHCQVGNIGLALDVMAAWLEDVS
jgi:pimeloyl-ACP methyl ester carboxylesterase